MRQPQICAIEGSYYNLSLWGWRDKRRRWGYQNPGEKLGPSMVCATGAGNMEEIQLLLEMCCLRKEEVGDGKILRFCLRLPYNTSPVPPIVPPLPETS